MVSIKQILGAVCLVGAAHGALAADVGVSISIGDPNFYGRIDIGNFPRPVLMYPQPVVIRPAPYAAAPAPLYLRVPPGHARDWGRYCGRYDACGVPVYFVQDRWYRNVYAPRYRADHDYDRHEARYDERRDRRPDRFDDREGRRPERFDDRGWQGDGGPGRGHGHEHGHGRGRD